MRSIPDFRELLAKWSYRQAPVTTSYVAYDRLEFTVEAAPESQCWTVRVVAQLHAAGRAATGPVLLNLGFCPLLLEEVGSSCTATIERVTTSSGVPVVVLTPVGEGETPWSGSQLTFKFRWAPDSAVSNGSEGGPGGTIAPCLVLPNMLPRLVSAEEPLAPPFRRLPRVFFKTELPESLDAGGIAIPDDTGKPTPELLQTVIFRKADRLIDAPSVAIGSSLQLDLAPNGLETAQNRMIEMANFVAEELRLVPSVRLVAWLDERAYPDVYIGTGAFCPITALAVGGVDPRVGQDLTVIRSLAQTWLDGGVQIYGENAASLRLAIAGALGLRWFEANNREAHLQTALAQQRRAVATALANNQWTASEIVYDIQLSLFESPRRKKVLDRVGQLFLAHWGEVIPQGAVIAILRRAGVRVPHVFE